MVAVELAHKITVVIIAFANLPFDPEIFSGADALPISYIKCVVLLPKDSISYAEAG